MRTRIPILLFVVAVLLRCGATPSVTPLAINCATVDQLRAALQVAETTPGTTIDLAHGGTYIVTSPIRVRGIGTKLVGNGALVVCNFWYSGLPDPITGEPMPGIPVLMNPKLGPIAAFTAQPNAVWLNDAGGAAKYDPSNGQFGAFHEEAPVQYPGPLYATYTAAYPILIPCVGCSITNLRIQGSGVEVCFSGYRCKGCTLDNVQVANTAKYATLCWEGAEDCTFQNIGSTVNGLQINSGTRCVIRNCTVGSIAFEELARWCVIDGCTVNEISINDATCSNNLISNNHVAAGITDHESGNIALIGNTIGNGGYWCNTAWVAGGIVAINTGVGIGPVPASVVVSGNSWQKP